MTFRMPAKVAAKVTAVWFAILVMAFLNGTLRELLLIPAFGKTPGLIASGILLSTVIVIFARAGERWYGPTTVGQAWRIGLFWLALTLVFEFGFGLLQGKSWRELLQAYAFRDGDLWPLVLGVVLVAPRLASGRHQGR